MGACVSFSMKLLCWRTILTKLTAEPLIPHEGLKLEWKKDAPQRLPGINIITFKLLHSDFSKTHEHLGEKTHTVKQFEKVECAKQLARNKNTIISSSLQQHPYQQRTTRSRWLFLFLQRWLLVGYMSHGGGRTWQTHKPWHHWLSGTFAVEIRPMLLLPAPASPALNLEGLF